MADKLFYQVGAVLCGSCLIFAAVAGWRQALWLIPAVLVGIYFYRHARRATHKPNPPQQNRE